MDGAAAVQAMVRAGGALRILDECAARFCRADGPRARQAYATLLDVEGKVPGPCDHVRWISDLSRNIGLHVCSRGALRCLCERAERDGRIGLDDIDPIDCAVDAFDPTAHVLVALDATSILAHLLPEDLGGAAIVAPHIKCALVWWDTPRA